MQDIQADCWNVKIVRSIVHYISILHNYFDSSKLFSDLYLVKFLAISVKLLFTCRIH